MSPNQKRDRDSGRRFWGLSAEWLRMYVVVLEFLAYIALLGYAGWWVEQRWRLQPWGLLVGLLAGVAAGTWRILREAKNLKL